MKRLLTIALTGAALLLAGINTSTAQTDVPLINTLLSAKATNLWVAAVAVGTPTNFVAAQTKTNTLRFGRGLGVMASAFTITNAIEYGGSVTNAGYFIDFALSFDRTNWTPALQSVTASSGRTFLRMWGLAGSNATPILSFTNFPESVIGNARYIKPVSFGRDTTNDATGNLCISNIWTFINYSTPN